MSFAAYSMYDELQVRSKQREVKIAQEKERARELTEARAEAQHLKEEVGGMMYFMGDSHA